VVDRERKADPAAPVAAGEKTEKAIRERDKP